MVVRDARPGGGSTQFKQNGYMHSSKQQHQCKACGRQGIPSAEDHLMSYEQRTLIKYLLREPTSFHYNLRRADTLPV